ncbi:hypothetical protein MHH81_20570 [Psychrobacillus sp. FSL H8-0484]|uniref:hypothetical protein n=1 Tax=Psychrobacillus sp. FSL H8-0484 TaxID=2921390 RepID=UPI0030F752F2
MFPKYIFSTTRFLLIIGVILFGAGTYYFFDNTGHSIWMFGILTSMFSTSYWFLFRFIGIIDRTAKLEEIEHHLLNGHEIVINKPTNWSKTKPIDRTSEQKIAALRYYKLVLKRIRDLTFAISLFATGTIIMNYSSFIEFIQK